MILFLTPLFFIFGTAVGSFLNVVAYRSVHGGLIFLDNSRCPHCKKKIVTADLVPIVSYFVLKGKCRCCKKPISAQYPIVEAATGFLFAFTFYYWFSFLGSWPLAINGQQLVFSTQDLGSVLYLTYLLFVVSTLVVLFVTDLRDGLLPNSVVLPAISVVAAYKLLLAFSPLSTLFSISSLLTDILAAFIAATAFFAISYFSKEKAMGGGDAKLVFLIGLAVGWPAAIVAVFTAFLTGAFVAVMLILIGKKRFGQTVPFGPFLSLGAAFGLFWGQEIVDLYLRVIIG